MRVFFATWLILVSIPASSAGHERVETISGRVVAYSTGLLCLNGNGYWSMIIRVEVPRRTQPEFIRVDFSLPCAKSPPWISGKTSVEKFHLFRRKERDAVLPQFMRIEPAQEEHWPVWKSPPGNEPVALPFGKVVPAYGSVDLPLLPIF
jgi:hypothetical protein